MDGHKDMNFVMIFAQKNTFYLFKNLFSSYFHQISVYMDVGLLTINT